MTVKEQGATRTARPIEIPGYRPPIPANDNRPGGVGGYRPPPVPANNNSPFRPGIKPHSVFGRRNYAPLFQGIGRASPLRRYYELFDYGTALIDPWLAARGWQDQYQVYGGGWQLSQSCSSPPNNPRIYKYMKWHPNVQTTACLQGQAVPGAVYWPGAIPGNARTIELWSRNNPQGAGGAYTKHKNWTRPQVQAEAGVAVLEHVWVLPSYENVISPEINPNVQRELPSLPNADPNIDPGLDPYADPPASPGPVPPPIRSLSIDPTPGVGIRPAPVTPRTPPPPNVRERKETTKSGQVARALFRALDNLSEASEVVDSVYEALPEDVKDRWDCNRRAPFIDNAGQYGIDNADCKAAALFHNWPHVDMNEAVKNIIANAIEDQIHGAIHGQLPPNTINAFEDAFREGGQALDDFLEWLMDQL